MSAAGSSVDLAGDEELVQATHGNQRAGNR